MDPPANETARGADDAKGQGSANDAEHRKMPRQSTLFDLEGFAPPTDPPIAEGTEMERMHARRCADALGAYLLDHPTATLERALAAAGLTPPPGARLCVVHPLAARWALRDGLAELSGGVTRATSPQANAGLVRIYRRPSAGIVARRVVKGGKR
jgi:hypothetical protein